MDVAVVVYKCLLSTKSNIKEVHACTLYILNYGKGSVARKSSIQQNSDRLQLKQNIRKI
jgi:hypothetical protein